MPHYMAIMKPLQIRKMDLLKPAPKAGNPRKVYSLRTHLDQPTEQEIASFCTLQDLLSQPSFLMHFDLKKRLYIDLDASKEFRFSTMIYHVKGNVLTTTRELKEAEYPVKTAVQPILFLS